MSSITRTLFKGDVLIRRVSNGWHVTRTAPPQLLQFGDEDSLHVVECVYRDRVNKPNKYSEAASLGDALYESFGPYQQGEHQAGLDLSVRETGYAVEGVPETDVGADEAHVAATSNAIEGPGKEVHRLEEETERQAREIKRLEAQLEDARTQHSVAVTALAVLTKENKLLWNTALGEGPEAKKIELDVLRLLHAAVLWLRFHGTEYSTGPGAILAGFGLAKTADPSEGIVDTHRLTDQGAVFISEVLTILKNNPL